MPKGGLLSITLTMDNPGGSASISIEDTGIGIPRERVETIFTDHITTKRKGFERFFAFLKRHIKRTTKLAFINANWRDF